MQPVPDILGNYLNRRHLLQNMHLPARPYGGPEFLYMKNHKAACTNILTFLITHMHKALGDTRPLSISMDGVHNQLSADYLRAGARALDWPTARRALAEPGWYRFTIIRAPLNRTVSAWADKLQTDTRHRRDLMAYLGRPSETEIGLSEFLDILAQDAGARDLDRHWRPQHKEISFGQVQYDFIGRVEAMETARQTIREVLFGRDTEGVSVPDTRTQLGHRSQSKTYLKALSAKDRRNFELAFSDDMAMYESVSTAEAA